MELNSTCKHDTIIYDVLWNVLQLSDYVDIMSTRLVDKKTYELITRIDLWSGLLSRDFIFLSEFDLRLANSNPERGYNIIRKYIFKYVLNIQKHFGMRDVPEIISTIIESIGMNNQNDVPISNDIMSCAIKNLGIKNSDFLRITDDIKTSFDKDTSKSEGLELKFEQNTLQNVFTSFRNSNICQRVSKNANDNTPLIISYRPSTTQRSIYKSLIEWREENIGEKIPEEIAELIISDIFDALDVPYPKYITKILEMLNSFVNDLNYGMHLHLLYNTNRPVVNKSNKTDEEEIKLDIKSIPENVEWWNKSSSESSTTNSEEISD